MSINRPRDWLRGGTARLIHAIARAREKHGRRALADAFIIDAVRTPRSIGKVGKGALSHMHPQHVAATVLRAVRDRNGIDTADVDDVIWGTSAQMVL